MKPPPVRIGIYTRISDDKDGEQTATARQLRDARAFAERKSWEIVDVFEDVDLSAFKSKVKRPEFQRMVTMLRSGEIDGVLVWKLDRLSRQQRDFATVMEACEAHRGFVVSVTEPINTLEPHGQFVAELLVAQARMESANTSARAKRKAQELREQGRPPNGGKRAFGYSKGCSAIVPGEAAVLREVRDRVFAGESIFSICQDLSARSVTTPWGKAFRPHSLKRTILSPTLRGEREHEGVSYPGTWEAIFSPDESKRLGLLLSRRPGQPRTSPARRYLLTGFLVCGRCGGRMRGHQKSRDVVRYICSKLPGTPGCGRMSARADSLESVVAEMVFAAVDDDALRDALTERENQDDGLIDEIRHDELSLEELARDFYAEKLLSREEFIAARTTLNVRLEANRTKLSKRSNSNVLAAYAGQPEVLRTGWEKGTLEWRRSVIGALLQHVEVLPGKPGRLPFDPERVRPVWKF
ncbi:MAG: recombinase family protein [Dehalococcoidia bacterium]